MVPLSGFHCIDKSPFTSNRTTWIIILIGLTSYGIFNIQGLIHQWEENAAITTINNFSADVNTVQFPTVTICPKNFPHDRWAIIKGYLNEMDNKDPEMMKEMFEEWKVVLEKYYEKYEEGLKKMIHLVDSISYGKIQCSPLKRPTDKRPFRFNGQCSRIVN